MKRYCTITLLFLASLVASAQLPKVASNNAMGPNGSLIGRNFPTNWLYVPVDSNGYLLVHGMGGGGGGGGGPTLQTNGVANTSQTTLNFVDTTSIAFNNSGANETATVISTGNNTVLGWNGSGVRTGFTAGASISLAGGQISFTGASGITGALSSNCIVKGTGAATAGCSLGIDNGTTWSISDPGGVILIATTPGINNLAAGSGAIPGGLAPNSFAWVAPVSGGTPYAYKACPTAGSGYVFAGTPFTGADNINEMNTCPLGAPRSIPVIAGPYGSYNTGTYLGGEQATYAGHFTNLHVVNTSPGTCSGVPSFNVIDFTTTLTGTAQPGPATGTVGGTVLDQPQNLGFAVGDSIGVIVSANQPSCGAYYAVTAQMVTP